MAQNDIRVAVLGLGRLGLFHASNMMNKVKGADLVLVCDPLAEHAEMVAEQLGVKRWTSDPEEVFADQDVDAVVIVTPTSTHADMITKAARSGKQIFVEKPLTSTVAEAEKVIKVVEETGVVCQVGFMRRYDPGFHDARERIEAGEIGKPIYFKGFSRDSGSPPASFIKNSGGIFLDCSIHDYDMARYLMGSEISSVSGHGRILINSFMEEYGDVDQAITYLEFENGGAGDVEASRTSPYGHDIRAEIIGTEGAIFVGSLRNSDVTVQSSTGSNHEIVPNFQTRFREAYILELEQFIKCVKGDEEPRVTSLDSKINMQVALAATESFKNNGERIYMKDVHQDKVYTD